MSDVFDAQEETLNKNKLLQLELKRYREVYL